ncbi:MAG TPA: hypothetical protein VGE75_08290 [Acidimicrobiales bacterium]
MNGEVRIGRRGIPRIARVRRCPREWDTREPWRLGARGLDPGPTNDSPARLDHRRESPRAGSATRYVLVATPGPGTDRRVPAFDHHGPEVAPLALHRAHSPRDAVGHDVGLRRFEHRARCRCASWHARRARGDPRNDLTD